MNLNRREFGKALMAAAPSVALVESAFAQQAPKPGSNAGRPINGVHLGIQSWSFHQELPANDQGLAIPKLIRFMKQIGFTECELYPGHREPWNGPVSSGTPDPTDPVAVKIREDARKWRSTVPDQYYFDIKKQFDDADLAVSTLTEGFNAAYSDEEREHAFRVAKILGASGISATTVISETRRLVAFVEKHKFPVAVHNHNNLTDPDQYATVKSFETALAMSPYIMATLDVGHFVAGNNDPIDFIGKHHDRVMAVHLRDRKRNNGRNTPFGQGDTPLKEILLLIKKNNYPIKCYIEYEYGSTCLPSVEIQRCFDFCREALA